MTASTAAFRKGLKIELEGEPYIITDFLHVKPGKGGAFVRTKLKSLVTGNVIDRTFRSGEKVQTPALDERNMQYLYHEGETYHFMDNDTYDKLCYLLLGVSGCDKLATLPRATFTRTFSDISTVTTVSVMPVIRP